MGFNSGFKGLNTQTYAQKTPLFIFIDRLIHSFITLSVLFNYSQMQTIYSVSDKGK